MPEGTEDKAQYANRSAMVKNIQVVDKYTLRFELRLPDPKFYLNVVDSLSAVVVPREAVKAPGRLFALAGGSQASE